MIIRYSSMPYTFDLLSRDLLLQRLAVRLNHNIVCHTSRGAGGLLGKRSMHRRCGWVNNSANRCRTSPPCGLGKMRTDATPFVVGQIRRVSPALHGTERRPPSRPPSTFQTVSRRVLLGNLASGTADSPKRAQPLSYSLLDMPHCYFG